MKTHLLNAALVFTSLAVLFVVLLGVDRLLGVRSQKSTQEVGLIFPPGTVATYDTLEFDFTVRINNLGFRDRETQLEKSHAVRVVVIGDSFVYGWGVALEDTWVKDIERRLREGGRDIEILNLGVPGFGPSQYADTAEDVIPLLNPDIVLVGLLQGDDLRQTENAVENAERVNEDGGAAIFSILRRFYPNLMDITSRRRMELFAGLNERSQLRWNFFNGIWKRQAKYVFSSMNSARKEMYQTWPGFVRRAFRQGELNPGLLKSPLVWGESDPDELDADSPLMQERIARCAEQLGRIKATAEDYGARVAVISIPVLEYTAPCIWLEMSGVEPAVQKMMLATLAPDRAVQEACDLAGLPMIEVTEHFRAQEDSETFFYPYDTHLTVEGHRKFGALIAPLVSEFLD